MKKTLFFSLLLLFCVACIKKGKQSKLVKYHGYQLVDDGNDGDSNFFLLSYENKSGFGMKEPWVRFVIKDTSNKMFKPILYSASQYLPDVPGNSEFQVRFYAEDFLFTSEVGKVKTYIEWTNSKGKKSIRRAVSFE